MAFRNVVNTGTTNQHPTHTHTHICAHAHTHAHSHAHTKFRVLHLMAETQQDRARPTAAGCEHYPAHEDQADGPSSAALSQAGVMGPGPATRYKIKNISNIQ